MELALKEEDCYPEVYWISWDVKLSVIPVTSVLLKLGVLKLGVCNPYDGNFLNSLRQIEFNFETFNFRPIIYKYSSYLMMIHITLSNFLGMGNQTTVGKHILRILEEKPHI